MAAPVTTARIAPVGIKMDDGHPTVFAFERDPDVSIWEKTAQPPGIDGGDAIETHTMHNVDWRQMAARALKTLTESSLTVAWDPAAWTQILDNLINRNGAITVHFPDGSTLDFFGYLRTFEPAEHEEGTQPEASCTIQPTNTDPADGSEEGPVLTSVAGT